MNTFPYSSPAAFRAALTDRLKVLAESSIFTVPELQRQFAYDRLLARVFFDTDDQWVLKGAVSLLARLGSARHSKDVDLAWQDSDGLLEAINSFRLAVSRDLGDYFHFNLGQPSDLADGKGQRIRIVADLGGRRFSSFSVDIVGRSPLVGTPDRVSPLVPLQIPGLVTRPYLVYPLVDHIADKVSACLEVRVRQSGDLIYSTRYKDLVDLVAIGLVQPVKANALRQAILSQLDRRGIEIPAEFTVPVETWRPGYEAKVREAVNIADITFDEGLALVKKIIDPLLAGTATGIWNPRLRRWDSSK